MRGLDPVMECFSSVFLRRYLFSSSSRRHPVLTIVTEGYSVSSLIPAEMISIFFQKIEIRFLKTMNIIGVKIVQRIGRKKYATAAVECRCFEKGIT